MTATGYISLLKDPAALHDWDEAHLAQLVQQYPYDQALQALYLKKLQLTDQEAYLQRLPLTAILSHDRKQLKRLSQQKLEKPTQAESLHTHVEETLDEVVEETHNPEEVSEIVEALHIEEPVVTTPTPEPEVEEEQEVVLPEPEEEEAPNQEPEITAQTEPEVTAAPEDVLEETEPQPEEVQQEQLPDPEPAWLGLPVVPEAHIEITQKKAVAEVAEETADEAEVPQAPSPGKMSFAAWLQHLKAGEPVPEGIEEPETVPPQEEPAPVDELDKLIRTGSYEAALLKETSQQVSKQEAPKEAPQPQTTEPQPEEPVTDDSKESAEIDQLAKKSMTIDDDVVTETLAKIFTIQKKYSKALDAYERLIVKFPEKEAHFREQMEVIRNK